MRALKITLGGAFGLLIGAILGFVAVAWWAMRGSTPHPPGQAVGWDPISLMHQPIFSGTVLFCALAFGYLFASLFSRIGRGKRPSQV